MAQSFRVAVMGNQGGIKSLPYFSYGLQAFDLCADQICRFVETPDMDKVTDIFGATPLMQYSEMAGGRSYPLVSREEVAQVMRGVEILVIVMSTRPYYMTYLSQEFFNYIFTENLSETCRHVVIRITKDEDAGTVNTDTQGRSRPSWRLRSERRVDPNKVIKMYGFEMEKIKAKVSIIADGVKLSKKTRKDSAEDPVKTRIAQLHSELTREEFKAAITQPMKETMTAGKSLLNLGQRFSNWLGSLIKSQ